MQTHFLILLAQFRELSGGLRVTGACLVPARPGLGSPGALPRPSPLLRGEARGDKAGCPGPKVRQVGHAAVPEETGTSRLEDWALEQFGTLRGTGPVPLALTSSPLYCFRQWSRRQVLDSQNDVISKSSLCFCDRKRALAGVAAPIRFKAYLPLWSPCSHSSQHAPGRPDDRRTLPVPEKRPLAKRLCHHSCAPGDAPRPLLLVP